MCGIIGILAKKNIVPDLLSGLKSLEYRGYDSVGISVLVDGQIVTHKAVGKIKVLEDALHKNTLKGTLGIGHTRWATHGGTSVENAHPHTTGDVAIVHNGIIENHQDLRKQLQDEGAVFLSDTDSEVVAHLATKYLRQGFTPEEAVLKTLKKLKGSYALAFVFKGHNDLMICARLGSPLAIGVQDDFMCVGSDALTLSPFVDQLIYLEEGDCAVLTEDGYKIYASEGQIVDRPLQRIDQKVGVISKNGFPHFMLKEIHDQPQVVQSLIKHGPAQLPDIDWSMVNQLILVACGTSYYAAMIAQYWFERYAKIPTRVEMSSEFRYRQPPLARNGVVCVISQSGETADTLAALKYAKGQGQTVVALVNVVQSSIARLADYVVDLRAGPEIGVASTKAFIAQLMNLLFIVQKACQDRGEDVILLSAQLRKLPAIIEKLLSLDTLQSLCAHLTGHKSILYLGRGIMYGVAMEGALKMKELSYIHAEGAPSGELKHGPIALVDAEIPIIYLLPDDELFEKSQSNLEEVLARGGNVFLFGCARAAQYKDRVNHFVLMDTLGPFLDAIQYVIPLQILSYRTALLEGNDVDQPRNLAKSVTVE